MYLRTNYRIFTYTRNMKIMNSDNILKSTTIIGIVFVLVLGTISHFVYDWSGQNTLVGFLVPVSESTWEHMKLLFFPMLLYALYMNQGLKQEYPCITSALCCGILAGTFLIPVFFYTYSGILGKNVMALDIATFIASVLCAFRIVYRLTLSGRFRAVTFPLMITVILLLLCFVLFTYLPPAIGLFQSF